MRNLNYCQSSDLFSTLEFSKIPFGTFVLISTSWMLLICLYYHIKCALSQFALRVKISCFDLLDSQFRSSKNWSKTALCHRMSMSKISGVSRVLPMNNCQRLCFSLTFSEKIVRIFKWTQYNHFSLHCSV